MATIKSFTDLEQSKKLAEILHPESADMFYHYNVGIKNYYEDVPRVVQVNNHFVFFHRDVPCWSLAALIKILPKGFLLMDGQDEADLYSVWVPGFNDSHIWKNNPVDACYEMILHLHELNLL